MIKLPVVAAFTTVLSHHLHSPSKTLNTDTMRDYARILNTLRIMAEKSRDLELLRARDVCMAMFSRVETRLRVSWMEDRAGEGGL